ncbi:MAG: hypothetical protein JWO97_4586 [Acidobacteria bacterium]|nr:hypothetical protein [Acidobacteriota bacterium]
MLQRILRLSSYGIQITSATARSIPALVRLATRVGFAATLVAHETTWPGSRDAFELGEWLLREGTLFFGGLQMWRFLSGAFRHLFNEITNAIRAIRDEDVATKAALVKMLRALVDQDRTPPPPGVIA